MLLGDELRAAVRAAYEEARELGAAEDPPEIIPTWDALPLAMWLGVHPRIWGRMPAGG